MIAVVIPCFKVKDKLFKVVNDIGPEVDIIYVVDDCCPQNSVSVVEELSQEKRSRVRVLRTPVNLGVGGAVKLGYTQALADGADIVVKIDGDGQMDTSLISKFTQPILLGHADYTKGNRFYDVESFSSMPMIRLIGNAGLSLINKFSHGYWDIVDPTNGYTAISKEVLKNVKLDKVENRYFFESDLLFRLGVCRAVVQDIVITSI
jgi:glycosyltransferase involved in cell wall biosynthesis